MILMVQFTIEKAGFISVLELVHRSALLVCHEQSTRLHCGCERPSYDDKTLMTIITCLCRLEAQPRSSAYPL